MCDKQPSSPCPCMENKSSAAPPPPPPPPQPPQCPQYPQNPQQQCCRPRPPTFWSKINCVPCNRLFFFVVGGAVGLYYDQLKKEVEKATREDEAGKNDKNQKGKNKKSR